MRDELIADRRHLHANPELAFEEHETAAFVAERLRSLGIEVTTGVGGTGVVGIIRGGGRDAPSCCAPTWTPSRSRRRATSRTSRPDPGVMHACGHDGHTAILLAVARILAGRRDPLPGNVVLCFQPAEERPPGGAIKMIEDGVMDDPKVDAVFGLHLIGSPVGTVGMRGGPSQASADSFRAEIIGVGGHAARPHKAVDPVLIAANVVTTLHTIVSREVDPLQSAVITVGTIQAGTVPNVIPATATMSGTVRTLDEEVRQKLGETHPGDDRRHRAGDGRRRHRRLRVRLPGHGQRPADDRHSSGTWPTKWSGKDRTRYNHPPIMPSEDVGYFIARATGCYFNVGVLNEAKGITITNHNPGFDIDEDALPVGVAMLVRIVERYLTEAP